MTLTMNPIKPAPPLSEDYLTILSLLVNGKTQDQIAVYFGLSRVTIKRHCRIIKERLGAESLYQAIAVAVSRGWVSPRSGNGK